MNKREFLIKAIQYISRNIRYFNVINPNIIGLAERERCYRKLKRKYKKILTIDKSITIDKNKEEKSNKIWICWFQGIENAPELVKACYNSVVKNYNDKEIIVLTEENYKQYVDIPEYILKKWEKGYITFAHFSDILRIELLSKYGGLWLDSTIFTTKRSELVFNENIELFVFKQVDLDRKNPLSIVASSWLMYSNKNNNIINLTKKLLHEYWKNYNHIINYNLIHLFFTLSTEVYKDEWNKVPTFNNISPHILQFELNDDFEEVRFNQIRGMSDFHKLNWRIKSENKNSYYNYIVDNYKKDIKNIRGKNND